MTDDRKHMKTLRLKIRDLDDQIFTLVARRLDLARGIGAIKVKHGLPIKDYKVEKEVVDLAAERAKSLGLHDKMAEELAHLLIRYAVSAQDEFRAKSGKASQTKASRILIAGGRGRMGLWLSDFFDSLGHEVLHFDTNAPQPSEVHDQDYRYPLVQNFVAAAQASDIVVLATPISATPALIDLLTQSQVKALCFDICSLKTPLLASIQRAIAMGLRIASIHPMFGPQVELLAGHNIIVCDAGHSAAASAIRDLFADTSARLVDLSLEQHDQVMSYVLGLSHITNLLFASTLANSGLSFGSLQQAASTTFTAQLQVTRPVTRENSNLYYEIQAENRFTPAMLTALQSELEALTRAITAQNKQLFLTRMEQGRAYLQDND